MHIIGIIGLTAMLLPLSTVQGQPEVTNPDTHRPFMADTSSPQGPCHFAQLASLKHMPFSDSYTITVKEHSGPLALPSFVFAKPQVDWPSNGVLQLEVHSIKRSWGYDCKLKSNQAIGAVLQWDDWESIEEVSCAKLNQAYQREVTSQPTSHPIVFSEHAIDTGPEWVMAPITSHISPVGDDQLQVSVPVQRTSVRQKPERYAGMHYCKMMPAG